MGNRGGGRILGNMGKKGMMGNMGDLGTVRDSDTSVTLFSPGLIFWFPVSQFPSTPT